MTTQSLLEVSDLSVTYRNGRRTTPAVHDVSFALRPGETVGLVGESGSGKSTIANAIVGLVPVEGGQIRFAGEDVTRLSFAHRRAFYRRVQVIFQDPYSSLNPARTIGTALTEPLRASGKQKRDELRGRVTAMLERVGLPADAAGRFPGEFSGGQRQRIAIARALMPSPELVICDEPTSALDLSVQAQVLNLLQDLQRDQGLSYLFVSHDLEVVRHMCDRIVVLYRGEVMESGTAEQVFTAPSHPYTYALHQAAPVPNPEQQRRRRRNTERSVPPRIVPPSPTGGACPFAGRCAWAKPRCSSEKPQLLRVLDGDAMVACHRFPEWRTEIDDEPRRSSPPSRPHMYAGSKPGSQPQDV